MSRGAGVRRAGWRAAGGFALLALLVSMGAPDVRAQNEPFTKTFPLKFDNREALDATLGPVKVNALTIANLGRGYSRGGLLRRPNPPSELSTTLRLAFDVDNPIEEEWRVTFTVEFRDKAGMVIDRVTREEDYEEERDTLEIEHPLLEYVLPMVADVRVTLMGRRT